MTKQKKIILKVTEHKASKQRRVNIPKSEKTLEEGDLVEVIKRELK
jgi:hypothetical protein